MIIKVIAVIIASILSAIAYRTGGASGYNTKYRDVGCSLLSCLLVGYLVSWHWTLILVFWLTWASLTTYWKFGQVNAKWYHWLITGAAYSLATLPFIVAEGHWLGFASRTIILGGATMIWSELNGNAVVEECGRGALITLTIPLILI